MRSTIGQLKDFFEGVIWQDIEDELHAWIEDIRDSLEGRNTLFIEDVNRLRGSVEAVRNVLALKETMIANKEDELKED